MRLLPNTKLTVNFVIVTKKICNYGLFLGGVFWGYDLDSSFHLVLELCQDPILLGKLLLDLTKVMNETAIDNKQKSKKFAHIVNNIFSDTLL